MQADQLKPERVDALDDAAEGGLVHELAAQNSQALLGSQFELRKRGPQRRARLASELQLEDLAHHDQPQTRRSTPLSRDPCIWNCLVATGARFGSHSVMGTTLRSVARLLP